MIDIHSWAANNQATDSLSSRAVTNPKRAHRHHHGSFGLGVFAAENGGRVVMMVVMVVLSQIRAAFRSRPRTSFSRDTVIECTEAYTDHLLA
jgi:hypothetical protein